MGFPRAYALNNITAILVQTRQATAYSSALPNILNPLNIDWNLEGIILEKRWNVDFKLFSPKTALRFLRSL